MDERRDESFVGCICSLLQEQRRACGVQDKHDENGRMLVNSEWGALNDGDKSVCSGQGQGSRAIPPLWPLFLSLSVLCLCALLSKALVAMRFCCPLMTAARARHSWRRQRLSRPCCVLLCSCALYSKSPHAPESAIQILARNKFDMELDRQSLHPNKQVCVVPLWGQQCNCATSARPAWICMEMAKRR